MVDGAFTFIVVERALAPGFKGPSGAGVVSVIQQNQSRMAARQKLFAPTTLHVGEASQRAHLLDISAGGARLHAAAPPPLRALVLLDCAGKRRAARVMWRDGAKIGLRFVVPLSAADVAAAIDGG